MVTAAELASDPPLRRGDMVWLAGLTTGHRMMRRQCTVTSATSAITITPAHVPRFRAVHEEVRAPPALHMASQHDSLISRAARNTTILHGPDIATV